MPRKLLARPGKSTGFAEDVAPPPAPLPRKPLAQRAFEEEHPPRRAVNLTASSYWLHEAKQLGLNLSKIFDEALEHSTREAMRARLKAEIAEYNEWHARHLDTFGLWSDGLRRVE